MEQLKAIFGLLVATSIHKVPCLRDYWSSDWVLSVPAFSRVMCRNRFFDIWNNIHLWQYENAKAWGQKLWQAFQGEAIYWWFENKFSNKLCPPPSASCIWGHDKYKGCTYLKQYMPMKPIKREIKVWCRADSTNGKTQQGVRHGLGYSVVTKLCETIKGHWYAIFCDNFFTS